MRFPAILVASLLAVGGAVYFFVDTNQKGLVTLEGAILKIRTYPLNENATLVFADFRVKNPTGAYFEVDKVEMFVDTSDSEPVPAAVLTRAEVEQVFAYQKMAGPKYNDPLIASNRVKAGESIDRMSAGRVELSEAAMDGRLGVRLRIHEFSGRVAEISESGRAK